MSETTQKTATRKLRIEVGALNLCRMVFDQKFQDVADKIPHYNLNSAQAKISLSEVFVPEIKARGLKDRDKATVELDEETYQSKIVETILEEAERQRLRFSDDARTRYEYMLQLAAALGADQKRISRNIVLPAFMQEHEPVSIEDAEYAKAQEVWKAEEKERDYENRYDPDYKPMCRACRNGKCDGTRDCWEGCEGCTCYGCETCFD